MRSTAHQKALPRRPHPGRWLRRVAGMALWAGAVGTQAGQAADGAALAPAQGPAAAADDGLGRDEVRGLCSCYRRTDRWALRALVLSSLGGRWHPDARDVVVDALRDRQLLLHAFAVEALLRTEPDQLRGIADVELMDLLVRKESRSRPLLRAERTLELLSRIAPDAGARSAAEWNHWWSRVRGDWAPAPWTFIEPARDHGPRTQAFMARALDLHEHGLDLAFCLDTTGSMQPTIDAVRDSLGAIVAVLSSVAPRFRVGVVQYRDLGDLDGGAAVLAPLSGRVEKVRGKLERLLAHGGGDGPERVERGLAEVLDRHKMGWRLGAEKLVILIGDAPPHPEDVEECIGRARAAHLAPFALRPETGVLRRVRPFVVSAVGVGELQVLPATGQTFSAIAQAGAGTYVPMLTAEGQNRDDPGRALLRHVLELSFGARWSGPIDVFLGTLLEYHDAGLR